MFPEEPLLRFNSPLTEQLQAPALDGGDWRSRCPQLSRAARGFPRRWEDLESPARCLEDPCASPPRSCGPLCPSEIKTPCLPACSLEGNLTVGSYILEGGKKHFIMETLTQMLTLAVWQGQAQRLARRRQRKRGSACGRRSSG